MHSDASMCRLFESLDTVEAGELLHAKAESNGLSCPLVVGEERLFMVYKICVSMYIYIQHYAHFTQVKCTLRKVKI